MLLHTERPSDEVIYGQTSLSKHQKIRVIWIHLTDMDNVPSYFWRTFTGALSVWNVQLAQKAVQLGFPGSGEARGKLFADLEDACRRFPLLIVVNNLQRIRKNPVYDFLQQLLDAENSIAILLYREGRWAEQEDTAADRYRYFSQEEERAYYQKKSLALSESDWLQLHEFTEGWAAAVVALANHLLAENREDILANFQAYLITWMENEHYSNYTDDMRALLRRLALLDDFSVEMLFALFDYSAAEVAATMEASPFVRYRHGSGRFYLCSQYRRYLQTAQIFSGERERDSFYIEAGDWHREQGEKLEAINYYRRVSAHEKILETMLQWKFQYTKELSRCYLEAIAEMPAEFLNAHPILYVIRFYMLSVQYRYQDVAAGIEQFLLQNERQGMSPDMRAAVGEAYVVSYNAANSLHYSPEKRLELVKRACAYLPQGSTFISLRYHTYADVPSIRLPKPEKDALEHDLESLRQLLPYHYQITNNHDFGLLELAEAEFSFYTWNLKDLPAALAKKAIYKGLEQEHYDIVCSACFLKMRYYCAKGLYPEMMDSYAELRRYAEQAHYSEFFAMPGLADGWLNLKLGRPREVPGWIRDEALNRASVTPRHVGRDRIMHAYYLLVNQEYDELLPYLENTMDVLEKRGQNLLRLDLWIMQAVALFNTKKTEDGVRALETAYDWSHTNNIIAPFAEFGKYMRPLFQYCRESKSCRIPEPWLEQVGKKAATYGAYQSKLQRTYSQFHTLQRTPLDSLTVKESKILLLLSRGLSRPKIAQQIGISLTTVNTTVNRIYKKIGVVSAVQAANIANQYHIEDLVEL